MIEIIFLSAGGFYFFLIGAFYIGILINKRQQAGDDWRPPPRDHGPSVSVLIPARNEADAITQTLKGLQQQTYPAKKLEVIVIDDHSTDNTADVVSQFIQEQGLNHFRLLTHRDDGAQPTYKKAAITYGMQFAKGEIIVTTDADCRVQPGWIEEMVKHYDDRTGMAAGLITFDREFERNVFHKLQTLEFAGVVFAGVGAAGIGAPLICNGSNLSYRRRAFDEVDGFKGHDHIPSGDDDLLMQNIHKKTDWKIRYILDRRTINYTRPVSNLSRFLNQRSRWASKGVHYPGLWISIMLFLIYFFYAGLFILTPLTIAGMFSVSVLLSGILLKSIPEFLVITQALSILNRKDLLPLFLLAEIFHIPYVVLVGFRGFFKLFQWKNG